MKLADVRKAVVAVVALAGQLVALGVLHGSALHWTQVGLAAATALGVYAVPNGVIPADVWWRRPRKKKPTDAGLTFVEFLIVITAICAVILVLYAVGVIR